MSPSLSPAGVCGYGHGVSISAAVVCDDDRMSDFGDQLRVALETSDRAALAQILHDDVIWGDCAGRDEVLRFVDATRSTGAPISDVSVEVGHDRLLVSFTLGANVVHQALFVSDGAISEICDAGDLDHARSLRPVGPLAEAASRPTRLRSVSPILVVRDLGAALGHFATLGFDVHAYEGEAAYGFAERDDVILHMAEDPALDPVANQCAVYLYVNDADAMYAQWRAARPAGRLVAPVDTDYGLREGAHIDPDGNLLRFGSSVRGTDTLTA
jgi:uncharacterized glyoxalase superfamily protein PhnB